jgi:hypothetical protein
MFPNKLSMPSFILVAVIFAPSVLFADEGSRPQEVISDSIVTVKTTDRYTFQSGVEHMPGKISVNQSDFELKDEAKAFGVLPVSAWFDYKRLDINENIPVGLPASLQGYRLGLGTKLPIPFINSKEYFIGVDVMPSWYSDGATFSERAFRVPFRTYLIYKPIDTLTDTFVFIAGVQTDVDADTPVSPIIGFNFKPNDRLDFHLASDDPTISYKLDDHWAVFAEYNTTLDEYNVTRDSQKNVVLKVSETIFGGGLKFKINEWLKASLSAGLNTGRQFAYRDNVGKADIKDAPYIKAQFFLKF